MWYVYDRDTTVIQKTLKTSAAAKAWITRKQREFQDRQNFYVSNDGPLFDWGYAEAKHFHERIEKKRRVRNLMTGQEIEINANTPRACDPSSELYWSM